MSRSRIDRILAAIDTGLQEAADYSYEVLDRRGRCWRCQKTPTAHPDETCIVCAFDLRGQLGDEHGPWTVEHPRKGTPAWAAGLGLASPSEGVWEWRPPGMSWDQWVGGW